ncbi:MULTISPECIES: DUF3891 family protein [Bacillaceae]|uniref:DUF3891 family protein n=1 Tax=Evansella alkalicola TaxID=745819 RepID=A0ABS6JT23_9BACI|nr:MULTISPECIES: DUF3891 family protein [Bacillaceae]MBU9721402.1 DUF3891 family protein [Bacillus alkalicola]
MIVRETDSEYIFIKQHDHAVISGKLSKAWKDTYFIGHNFRNSVNYAIAHHDRCWQELDNNKPLILEEGKIPASFIEYPLEEKINAYSIGVNWMENQDPYAALLISKHYASFFSGKLDPQGKVFKSEEERRQGYLLQDTRIKKEHLKFHFDLLQLCDNLSLYICMNEWGVEKEREIDWFKEGFPQRLEPLNHIPLMGKWESKHEVRLTPFPFSEHIEVAIPYKKVKKSTLALNIAPFKKILEETKTEYHSVTYC